MSIPEFVRMVPEIGNLRHADRIKLFAWYLLRHETKGEFSASDISKCFDKTHFSPPSSIGPFLQSLANQKPNVLVRRGKGLYSLEHNVVAKFDNRFGQRPAAIAIKHDLRKHLAKVTDVELKDYLQETIGCLDSGHFRATVVMGWCAGYAILKSWLFTNHAAALNAVMAVWRQPKTLTCLGDFEDFTERVVIDTARTARVLTKEQHKHLVALLDQRNSFAHPSGRKASAPLAEAYLMQIIDEVVEKYS